MQAGSGRNVVPADALLKVETRGESEAINQYVFERAQAVITGAAALYAVTAGVNLMGQRPPAPPPRPGSIICASRQSRARRDSCH